MQCLAVPVAIGLAAQTPSPSQLRSSSAKDHVAVMGCVELALPPAPTTGNTEVGPTDAMFLLTNTTPRKLDPAKAVENTDRNRLPGKTFRLEASAMTLTPHIGQRVEVTGTVENELSLKSGVAAPPSGPASAAAAPKLNVESIQMIAATCSDIVARK